VACELLDLLGLLIDDGRGTIELGIDELLVGLVDERCEEEGRGREERKAPKWDDLDEVVGDEGTEESGCRYEHILDEDNPLRFNNEEVEELVEVSSKRIESLLW